MAVILKRTLTHIYIHTHRCEYRFIGGDILCMCAGTSESWIVLFELFMYF